MTIVFSTSSRTTMQNVFLARQPIFDRQRRLVGYELLYRGAAADQSAPLETTTSARMSADVLLHTVLGQGLERVTGGKTAFLNIDREVLLAAPLGMLDPKHVVFELLETVNDDPEVMAACEDLAQRGFVLALDDFDDEPSRAALLPHVKVVKVDVLHRAPEELATVVARLRPHGVRLVAERVETAEVRDACEAAGFDLFQGYFYSRPETLERRDLSGETATIVRLLNVLRDPDASDRAIEEAFKGDLALTYKLLRMVNSAAMGGRGVESIPQAVRLVGRGALHRWLSLLLVSSFAGESGVRHELVQAAMLRARLCEQLGEGLRGRSAAAEASFMVGLFSLIDALLSMPMEAVLERVGLSAEVRAALLHRGGDYGPILRIVEAYERGEWDTVIAASHEAGVPSETLVDLYTASAEWARQSMSAIAA